MQTAFLHFSCFNPLKINFILTLIAFGGLSSIFNRILNFFSLFSPYLCLTLSYENILVHTEEFCSRLKWSEILFLPFKRICVENYVFYVVFLTCSCGIFVMSNNTHTKKLILVKNGIIIIKDNRECCLKKYLKKCLE